MKGENHKNLKPEERAIYIFGSESQGTRPELEKIVDKSYSIAGHGQAESLNVAISVAVVMAQLK